MDTDTTATAAQATTQVPADAPPDGLAEGVLAGGWSYIWAAYIMTWCFLLGYAIYVNVRRYLATRPAQEPPA